MYALGGGHGHAVRGSALAAALERQGAAATVLLPRERVPVAEQLGARVVPMVRPKDAVDLAGAVGRVLEQQQTQLLVLDTFPEGLYDELSAVTAAVPRVALLRCRRDAESERLRRGHAGCVHCFDLEPHLRWRPEALSAEPFGPVVRPLPSVPAVIDVLILGGEPPLTGLARRLASRLRAAGLRVAWTDGEGLHGMGTIAPSHPLPPEVLGAPVVVGPTGFNLTYEVRKLGGWHVALPRPRPFDDQARRARALAQLAGSPQALERLVLQLYRSRPPKREPVVHEADALAARVHALWPRLVQDRRDL